MVNKFAADMLNMPGNGDISAAVQEAEKSALTDQIGVIGENMQIRRAVKWEGGERYVSYHHDGGRVSVLVEVEGESDPAILNDICLHIAAFRPELHHRKRCPGGSHREGKKRLRRRLIRS